MITIERSENDRSFEKGDLVKHFKHELDKSKYIYRIIGLAKHTETQETMVIYQDLKTDHLFARPYNMFVSEVDKNKYPNIKQKYRFERIKLEEI